MIANRPSGFCFPFAVEIGFVIDLQTYVAYTSALLP